MIDVNDIVVGSIVFILAYITVRMWLARKRPNPYQEELKKVLTGNEYKVKGRVESRAVEQVE